MAFGRLAAVLALVVVSGFVGCRDATSSPHGSSSLGGGGPGGSAGGGGLVLGGGGSAATTISLTTAPTAADSGRTTACDDAGLCSCLNIASLGKPAHWGAVPGKDTTDAFISWLNTKSSAQVDQITTRPTLTADLLAAYDVLILQELTDTSGGTSFWTFTDVEMWNLAEWVRNGGGLITLTGYDAQMGEVDPVNQLLAFTGIGYNKDDRIATCPDNTPGNCYCWGNSVPLAGWVPSSPISTNVTQVGAFHGRSIQRGDASVVNTDGTFVYAVTKEVGKGRVFVFGDEWVTYSSQWTGRIPENDDPNNACYQKAAGDVFQVPQFWYNVISWVAPRAPCFTIEDPAVVPLPR